MKFKRFLPPRSKSSSSHRNNQNPFGRDIKREVIDAIDEAVDGITDYYIRPNERKRREEALRIEANRDRLREERRQKIYEDRFFSGHPPTIQEDPDFYGPHSPRPEPYDPWFRNKYPPHFGDGSYKARQRENMTPTPDNTDWQGYGSDTGGGSGAGWGLPVVLDLGQDGITIVPLSQSTARFDLAGRGSRQVVAWVGPEDGFLVYDKDGDRLISDRDEIAFADYLATARTDLEGLAWFDQLAQGGNADGVLDERDAAWSKFGVWQDTDQDGETDPGELRLSGEGGISSINLTSDQQPVDAGPDAKVFGRSTYEYLDHNGIVKTAQAYDTALRYEQAEAEHKARARRLYDHPTNRRDYQHPPVVCTDPDAQTPIMPAKPRMYDHPTSQAGFTPPPLVRHDGQALSAREVMYPESAYNEATHRPWHGTRYQR